MERIMAVAAPELKYAERLCSYINRKNAFKLLAVPFNNIQELKDYSERHRIELLLADESYLGSYKEEGRDGEDKILITDIDASVRMYLTSETVTGLREDGAAYGTESIPKVYKIVGPGNIFVALAKKLVFGTVSIDMIAGPSEILVVADGKADARHVAADMLSQAEHDKLASAVLVTDSAALAKDVAAEIDRQLETLPRREIASASIENNGKIIVTDSIERAVEVANAIAPEHLEMCVENPHAWLDKIKNAGSVFLGGYTPEALGDYYAGPNHTLPTGGSAKFSSPLSVDDFLKKTQYIMYSAEAHYWRY